MKVLSLVAQILVDDYQFGTCADLNLCSQQVYVNTLPILWRTVYLTVEDFSINEVLYHYCWEDATSSLGWSYTR